MHRITFIRLLIISLFPFVNCLSQIIKYDELNEKGIYYLNNKDTVQATFYFKESIQQFKNPNSYFYLALIYMNNRQYPVMNEAYSLFEAAIEKDPLNTKYRFEYGKYLEMIDVKVRDDITARKKAIEQYKSILELNPNYSQAYYRLGKILYYDYLDYNNSYQKETYAPSENYFITSASGRAKIKEMQWDIAQDAHVSFEKEAMVSFNEAEVYLNSAITSDSLLYEAYTLLAGLYEDAGEYQKSINVVNTLIKKKNNDFSYHTILALLYYRITDNETADKEFRVALELMPINVKNDYLVGSVKILLQSFLDKKIILKEEEIQNIINNYWASRDPLVLTDTNERLLEHFARVTYANLRFGVESQRTKGWETDRGEALIRYGFPDKKIRYRPNTLDNGRKFIRLIKTDIWVYKNFTLAFTDQFLTNQFQFCSPYTSGAISQYPGNTDDLIKLDMRYTKPEVYIPNFKGPVFNIPYKAYQFATKDKSKTEVFVGYQINYEDTATTNEQFSEGYDVGLFLIDRNLSRVFESKQTIVNPIKTESESYNAISMNSKPQSGNLAFEIIRKKDNGVAAYHGKFIVRDFNSNELQLSDIVFAKQIETEGKLEGAIKRKNISIVANPTNQFNSKDQIYLYYEIYNLGKKSSYTDFEQKLTIQKKGDGGIIGSVLSVVGLDGKGNKIMLTSNYQTEEQDPQMYLQLDMSKYDAGNYLVTVTIKDKNSGKTISASSELTWQ